MTPIVFSFCKNPAVNNELNYGGLNGREEMDWDLSTAGV